MISMSLKSHPPNFWRSIIAWTSASNTAYGVKLPVGVAPTQPNSSCDYMRNRARDSFTCDPAPTHALTWPDKDMPHAQQILCFSSKWASWEGWCGRRVHRAISLALGHIWGPPGKKDNRSGTRQPQYFSTSSRQHNFRAVLTDSLSFAQRRRSYIN